MTTAKQVLLDEAPNSYGSNQHLDDEAVAIGKKGDAVHSSRDSLDDHCSNWSVTFRDGQRRTDFVLVLNNAVKNERDTEKRNIFEQNLAQQGLELEYENAFKGWSHGAADDVDRSLRTGGDAQADEPAEQAAQKKETMSLSYVKIHAPDAVLRRYAEMLKMLMPVRKHIDELVRAGRMIRGQACRELLAEQGYKFEQSVIDESASQSYEVQRTSQAHLLEMPPPALDAGARKDGCITRMYRKFNMFPDVEPIEYRTAVLYSRNRQFLFDSDDLFLPKDRSYIVDFILQRESYMCLNDEKDKDKAGAGEREQPKAVEAAVRDKKQTTTNEFGINRLLATNVYLAAFPLHDCPLDCEEEEELVKYKDTLRHKLWRQWARWGMAFKLQPLSHIQMYFGDTIAFYFAWLGFYTAWLVPLMLFGFIVFIYGLIVASTDPITSSLCNSNSTMCPLCLDGCTYWTMANQCSNLIIGRVWENEMTFIWGVVVTLWCTLFIEFWKRREGMLRFEWNLFKLEHDDEPPRPEYAALVQQAQANPKSKIKVKVDAVTGKQEPDVPYWGVRVPSYAVSWLTVFVAMLIVLLTIVGTIFYRVFLLTLFYRTGGFWLVTFGSSIASITGALISLCFIMVLGFLYDRVAVWMTDREYWRTQSEYNNALMMKQTLFQFVNYYGSIFYVAFFKGNFGTVGEYALLITQDPTQAGSKEGLDFGIETCPSGSCIPDLTIQLAIIMVGKQLVYGNLMELLLPKVMKFVMGCLKKSDSQNKVAEIQRNQALFGNYDHESNGPRPLFSEYLEMVIQFGFLSIFAIAFPFAPLFAFINNIVEIRLDAMKFLKEHRRVVASFDTGIGAWLTSLYAISRIAVLTNGALIAFTSDLIPRLLYDNEYKNEMVYENFTMSYLNSTILGVTNRTLTVGRTQFYIDPVYCLYNDFRNPPWASGADVPYDYSKLYWIVLAYRFITFAVFENVILFITALIAYVIPDLPRETEEEMRQERYFGRQITAALEEEFTKRRLGSTRNKKQTPLDAAPPPGASTSRGAGASTSRGAGAAEAAAAAEPGPDLKEVAYYDLPPIETTQPKSKRKSHSKPAELEMNPLTDQNDQNDQVSITNRSNL